MANEGAALDEKVLSESPPGEEVQEETDVDLPPSDVASFFSYESAPLSEPGSVSSSESTLNNEGQRLT